MKIKIIGKHHKQYMIRYYLDHEDYNSEVDFKSMGQIINPTDKTISPIMPILSFTAHSPYWEDCDNIDDTTLLQWLRECYKKQCNL